MQINTSSLIDALSQQISTQESRIANLQIQLASGQALNEPSDNPSKVTQVMQLSAQASQLEVALGSRDIIGQAKGILMAQNHITSEQAFGILRSKSQVLNKKLRDIAEFVAMTGELPSKDSKWL